jgi:hypothetical protein
MSIIVPYESSGQQLGETRQAMTKRLMLDIEEMVNKYKNRDEKYFILVHAKPFPKKPNVIKIKLVPLNVKPRMMLSCMLFGVDNRQGKLTLEWALPGDWPTWSVGGTSEPVPEVIASVNQSGVQYHYDDLLPS